MRSQITTSRSDNYTDFQRRQSHPDGEIFKTENMKLTKIEISDFKKIKSVAVNLEAINVIVGGNNAGKSSFLQAIHFAVTLAVANREASETTFSTDRLMYLPAADFNDLRHGEPYQNNKIKGVYSGVTFTASDVINDNEEIFAYKISIRRGRNYGNISCEREGNYLNLGVKITDSNRPFSVYVPGLAGIPQFEEFRSRRTVLKGVASGDANLYLRNVLFLLQKASPSKFKNLIKWMKRLFPSFSLTVKFNEDRDTTIKVLINLNERETPLELVGTGVQQALQIFSYVSLFEPTLLLLDEPDSHLHPTNQYALAEALKIVALESSTCVIASTHSKGHSAKVGVTPDILSA